MVPLIPVPHFSRLTLAFTLAACLIPLTAQARDRYQEQRLRMVSEMIEKEGVSNPRVLLAMRTVPRHEFVPLSQRSRAYQDAALPIGYKQTISPPFIVAYMTETIDPQPDDRVLEIGTGSGYQAAVLSHLVKEVYTIEIVEQLGEQAAKRLKTLKYDNVFPKIGDGYKGWPEHAPFDKIIVTCSPEAVPQPLIDQLKDGGKMLIPLGERYQQVFHLLEKRDGKLVETRLQPTLFVPMTGISEEQRQVRPDPLHPRLINANFEEDENGDGLVDHWHYQRQASIGHDAAPEGKSYLLIENTEPGRPAQALQGLALDGSKLGTIQISLRVKLTNARPGPESYEKPAVVIHFYDADRRPISEGVVGPWTGTFDWRTVTTDIPIPNRTREAIVRVGLNGATGMLGIDDVRFGAKPR